MGGRTRTPLDMRHALTSEDGKFVRGCAFQWRGGYAALVARRNDGCVMALLTERQDALNMLGGEVCKAEEDGYNVAMLYTASPVTREEVTEALLKCKMSFGEPDSGPLTYIEPELAPVSAAGSCPVRKTLYARALECTGGESA